MSIPREWMASLARLGLAACLLGACVNRGMRSDDPDAADPGVDHPMVADGTLESSDGRVETTDLGIDGAAGRSGQGGGAGSGSDASGSGGGVGTGGNGVGGAVGSGGSGVGGRSGTGGAVGTGGANGTGGAGTGGAGTGGSIADAGAPDLPRVCSARFNFEGGALYGAFINTGFQTAFSNLSNGTDAACGSGALRMNVSVTPAAEKGEVLIPLGATEDLSGKTLSLAVKTTPAPPPNAYVLVFLVPSYTLVTVFDPIPAAYATNSVTLPAGADAGAGVRSTTQIAIQVLGRGDTYSGVISIDELDLR
jgi:hypothetical protein